MNTIDENVARLIELIDELLVLIDNENRELASGLPATLSVSIGAKAALAADFETWVGKVRNNQILLDWASPTLRRDLSARADVLDAAIQENMGRLRAGIDATRYRVDAIMRAIREQKARGSGYNSVGRRSLFDNVNTGLLA